MRGSVVPFDDKAGRITRIWTRIGLHTKGSPFTVGHVCAALLADVAVDGLSATLMGGGAARETLYASDTLASELQEWQFTLGEGPSEDAYALGGPVLVPDLGSPRFTTRWPVFGARASAAGAHAVFAFPMQVGAIRLGVLDLYRRAAGALTPRELSDAFAFADAACMLLLAEADERRSTEAGELSWHLAEQSVRQAQVHRATGMVLVQLDTSAEAALTRLRAYAYAHDMSLSEVATEVVERRLRFEPDPPANDNDGR